MISARSLKYILTGLIALAVLFTPIEMLFSQGTPAQTGTTLTKPPTEAQQKATAAQIRAQQQQQFDNFKRPSLVTQGVALTLLSLSPFIIMILTSFMKIVIVLSLLRSALGVQQAPPTRSSTVSRLCFPFLSCILL